ncbi:4-hydroxy-3-methylbut-2-enyl diphosphate reductase [Humisphaera borealis]|uniref:4-hydroxy-3-methylbut-2-enyl diphosphate reductase n=1 Tax=Humisphaera borealis TaxID=2807512 RepID=A0A7M2WS85_9BACT|nr:4-hydroxy-3-methylbut-2-enyl diphosphate reductase [Humisphaera borealis]QOV88303.1 4-hydroxy-3-methylbut-2-enyl diphosphate reductase [Humisphaera borealis]
MKIILANPRGFCAGVNMAIDVVDQVLKLKGAPVYVFHEIVHNKHVVEDFQSRGVTFVNEIDEVPEGAVIVYSAHGISPAVRQSSKARNLVEIDATCPLVTKVHLEVLKFAKDGYSIVFIGHRNHDEAVGTVGEAPGQIFVVEDEEEVERLNLPNADRVAYVTQTTLSVNDANRMIAALKRKFPHIKAPAKEDICYATTNRQNAVTALSADAEVVLVVGSKNSSNSQRLVDTARQIGKAGYLIDDAKQLDPAWLKDAGGVFITAGASAPERLVQELIERLQQEFGGVVETRTLVDEDVTFAPPKTLRSLAVVA